MPAPTMNIAPLTVNFTNTSVGDGLTYSWNFGDGGTSTQANPTHTFQAGVWEVSLTVTNDSGTDTTSSTIVALPSSANETMNMNGNQQNNNQQNNNQQNNNQQNNNQQNNNQQNQGPNKGGIAP